MINVHLIERPAFTIAGWKTWISGPDNEQFGRFWQQSRADGLFDIFQRMKESSGFHAGPQTNAAVLGVSRVEKDPANRSFYYMIAIEILEGCSAESLEPYQVPGARWAVFECRGKIPESIVQAEMYAFTQWLPNYGYRHALAPEMEVYPATAEEDYCEFWLPVEMKQ